MGALQEKREQEVRLLFKTGIIIKGLVSFIEIVAGVLALFIPVSLVTDFVLHLAENELAQEPGDFIATHLVSYAHEFALASGTFIAVYLLSRGLIKLVLIIALLKDKLWAYPSSLGVLGLFVMYQLYQIATSHSLVVVALTLFDLVVMYLIWKEYTILREHLKNKI